MTSEADNAAEMLSSAHQALVEIFSALDRAGEAIVAAHLLSAIDSIEDRLGLAADQRQGWQGNGPVAQVADAMIEAFAEEAEPVARRQLVGSSGSAVVAWAAIVTRIGGRLTSPA